MLRSLAVVGLICAGTSVAQEPSDPDSRAHEQVARPGRPSRTDLIDLIVRDNIDRLKVSPVPDPVAALRAGLAASGDLRERERQLASAAASIDPSVIPLGELSALILDPGQPLEIQRQCLLLTCRAMLSETNAPEAERILFATMRSADISVDVSRPRRSVQRHPGCFRSRVHARVHPIAPR